MDTRSDRSLQHTDVVSVGLLTYPLELYEEERLQCAVWLLRMLWPLSTPIYGAMSSVR